MNLRDVTKTCVWAIWTLTILIPVLCHARSIPYFSLQQRFFPEDEGVEANKVKRMGDDGLNISLCPGGMDRISCIHSYLSLYARMKNGRTDPVSLRNIGKRGGYDKKGALMCPPKMDKVQCYDNAIAYYIRVMRLLSS